MNDILRSVGEPDVSLDSAEVFCWSNGCREAATITSAVAIRNDLAYWWPVELLDDATIVLAVQVFLKRKKAGLPIVPGQQQVWDHFYRQYHPLVRRVVAASRRGAVSSIEPDDLSQEVWGEILGQLQKRTYNPDKAGLSSRLVGLARRKACRLASFLCPTLAQCFVKIESMAELLQSRDLGPEDVCFMGEVWAQLEAALAKLRQQTSSKTYEVFCRRYFWRQSVKAVAAALALSSNDVWCRYRRVRRKWRALTEGLAILGDVIDVPPRETSPHPRKAK